MNNPKVSIIVPVYGVERYIERCAISLFEQTYPNIEYVFVNDATPDKSIDVLQSVMERYPKRKPSVHIVNHLQNKGIFAVRNTGIAASTGEYILYVDSDDYLDVVAIEHLVTEASKTNSDILLFDTNVVTKNGVRAERVTYTNKIKYIRQLIQHTAKCAHWNKFYRADFVRQSEIRSDERIRMAEDYAVTPRLVHQAEKISVLHEPLYFYETTNQSSYVHNLTRTAIESQRRADLILMRYFKQVSDAYNYADVVSAIPQRSMTSLIKNTDIETWPEILDVYQECLSLPLEKGMSFINRIIFSLAKSRRLKTLQVFMCFYHLVMRNDR